MGIFQRKVEVSSPSPPVNSLKRRSSVENKKRKQGLTEADTEKWPHSISAQEHESKKEKEYNHHNGDAVGLATDVKGEERRIKNLDPPVPVGKAPTFDFDNPAANAACVVRIKTKAIKDPYSKRKAHFESKPKLDPIDESESGSGTSNEATPRTSARFSSDSDEWPGEPRTTVVQAEISRIPEELEELASPEPVISNLQDSSEISSYQKAPKDLETAESEELPSRSRPLERLDSLEDPLILDRPDSPEVIKDDDSDRSVSTSPRSESPGIQGMPNRYDPMVPEENNLMSLPRSESLVSIEAPKILAPRENITLEESPRNSLEITPESSNRESTAHHPERPESPSSVGSSESPSRKKRAEVLRAKVINMGNHTRMDMGFGDMKDVGVDTRMDTGIDTDPDVSIEASIEAVTDLFSAALGEKVMGTQTGDSLRLASDRMALISHAMSSSVYVVDSQVGPDHQTFYVNGHSGGGSLSDNKSFSEISTLGEDTVDMPLDRTPKRKRSDRMWMCIIIVLALVILGVIASGIAIYFAVRATQGRKEPGQSSGVVASTYYMRMRLQGKQYNPLYRDGDSEEFSFLETEFCSIVRAILSASALRSSYQGCSVLEFKSGSIIVLAKLSFNRDKLREQEEFPSASISETLIEYFRYYLEHDMLPAVLDFNRDYNPDVQSVHVVRFFHELTDP